MKSLKPMKSLATLVFAVALVLALTACGANAASSASSSASGESASAESSATSGGAQAAYEQALMGRGLVLTFVGNNVADTTVANEDEALAVVKSLIERIGGDKTTELDLMTIFPTETGNTYYIFRQQAGDVMVNGASVKLIVDKSNKVTGLVSAILPDVKLPPADEASISKEQAEKAVVDELAGAGMTGAKALSTYTTQTIIPVPGAESNSLLAWVVYVESLSDDGDDQAYLANYVGMNGEYLYRIPVSEPNSEDALKGDKIAFDFGAYDQQEKTFELANGGEITQVTVPVLVDKQSGKVAFMGDAKRQILCVDFSEWGENERFVSPFEADGESFNDNDVAVYANFIRVYDFFESMGWQGPDDQGTPTLLKMNYKEDGEPAANCTYGGFKNGWETFAFGRVNDYGLAVDVVAHEFTHCVTRTTMTSNLYRNEPGAINEGMSDIMGNLAEMYLDGDAGAWTIGEKAVSGGTRSMRDPATHYQPACRWDVYYVCDASEGTEFNDEGGVHTNSSLLNIVSYKLDKAGMSVEDQAYFWMNVALAMVPSTDFAQMAELLPWVLEQSGYSQYAGALKEAIDEAGYVKLEKPSQLPAGAGEVALAYPNAEAADQGHVRVMFFDGPSTQKGTSDIWAWPIAKTHIASMTLPAGDYYVLVTAGEDLSIALNKIYTDKGWVEFDLESNAFAEKGTLVHVDEGKTIDLAIDGLG